MRRCGKNWKGMAICLTIGGSNVWSKWKETTQIESPPGWALNYSRVRIELGTGKA